MVDYCGQWSPAARDAFTRASAQGRTHLGRFVTELCSQPHHGASRMFGQLSVAHHELTAAVDDFGDLFADRDTYARELAGGMQIMNCPETTAGVLCAILGSSAPEGAELASRLRERFWVTAQDVRDCALRVARDALSDIEALVARPAAPRDTPADTPQMAVAVPDSAVIRRLLYQAGIAAERHQGRQIDSSALMTASLSWHATAADHDLLMACGVSPSLIGSHAARPPDEPDDLAVAVVGTGSSVSFVPCTTAAAAVLDTFARRSAAGWGAGVGGQLVILAQLAAEQSQLARLLDRRLPGDLTAVERYAHTVKPAGLSAQQLELASKLGASSESGDVRAADDFTEFLVVHFLGQLMHAPAPPRLIRLEQFLPGSQRHLLGRYAELIAAGAVSSVGSASVLEDVDAKLFGGAVEFAHAVAGEYLLGGDPAVIERWSAIARLVGLPAFADGGADAAAIATRLVPPARVHTATARLEFKTRLQARQSDGREHQSWASRVGGSWERVAIDLAAEAQYERAATAIVQSARISATTSAWSRQSGRRTQVLPAPAFAQSDIEAWEEPTVYIAVDGERRACVLQRRGEPWQGSSGEIPDGLGAWWSSWRSAVRSGMLGQPLEALIAMLEIPVSWMDERLRVVAAGEARALPLAQALTAQGQRVPIVHLLGGIGPTAAISPLHADIEGMSLIHDPPGSGPHLPAAGLEAAVLGERLRPASRLSGDRVARAWLQRTLAAMWDVPTPELLHFAGHGTFARLPDGRPAAALVLSEREPFTPDDLRAIDAAVRVMVCSACDLGAAAPAAINVDPWPLAAILSGVEWVLAAAWPVSDAATALTMIDLYERWVSGADLLGALADAVDWIRTCSTRALLDRVAQLTSDAQVSRELAEEIELAAQLSDPPFGAAVDFAGFGLYTV